LEQKFATTRESDCHTTVTSDWSSTQSSPCMKTPSEGWSEVGSDTTKEIYEETTPIMFHELSKAAEHTEEFTRYLEVLLKNNTNTNTNPKNTASPEGEYAEKIEDLHRKYSQLVNDLQRLLHVTQQEPLLEHVSSTQISPLTSQRTNQAIYSDSLRDRLGDQVLETFFSDISSGVKAEDIARLTRYWTWGYSFGNSSVVG
jgi:hypothetical protein